MTVIHKEVVKEKLRRLYARLKQLNYQHNDLLYVNIIVLIAKSLRPHTYVELGVYQCDVINKVIPYVKDNAYAIDISANSKLFLKNDNRANFLLGTAREFAKKIATEKITIDMLFIDADHRKDAVLDDFNTLFPYVREDGIIFLHDGYPRNIEQTKDGYCSNSWEAIDELTRAAGDAYEMMTIPQHPGLTLCRKRTKQIPWI